jgi:alanine-synthesizing transaminase
MCSEDLGKGTDKNPLQRALERERAAGPVIDLIDTNFHRNGLLFPAEPLQRLAAEYLAQRCYDPDPKGSLPARRAIAAYYAQYGIHAAAEQILITASTSESYSLLFATLAPGGGSVLLPRPGYPLFEHLARMAHLEPRYYDLDPACDFRLDPHAIEAALDGAAAEGSDARLVVMISPNNPTGQVAGEQEITALLSLCERHRLPLVVDEVFSEFLYTGEALPRPAAAGATVPVFTLNGISKMFACPDLKLSWIVATGDHRRLRPVLADLELANDTFLSCTSLSQHLLPRLFGEGRDFVREMVEQVKRRRQLMLERLGGSAQLRPVEPRGGIHCIVRVDGGAGRLDDEALALELLVRRKVYVHPGYFYDIEDRPSLVISFLKEPAELAAGLDRLVAFAQRLSP